MSQWGSTEESKAQLLQDALPEDAQAISTEQIRENLRTAGLDPDQVVAECRAMALDLVRKSRAAQRQQTNEHQAVPAPSPEPRDVAKRCVATDHARRLSEEAAYWYVRSGDEEMSIRDRRKFLAWLRASPQHICELLNFSRLDFGWQTSHSSSRPHSQLIEDARMLFSGRSAQALHRQSAHSSRKNTLRLKLGAVAALLIVGALAGREYIKSERSVATGASEWRNMILPDGSAVHLDARSSIEVGYTDRARTIHMNNGRAVFEVARNEKWPFIVSTDLVDVTAIGTRFQVATSAGVVTTVSEGVVTVTGRGRRDGKSVTLKAGETLRTTDGDLTSPRVAQVDAERKLQWARDGRLNLGGMTVAQGIEELNSRNRVQIIVESPALAARVIEAAIVRMNAPEKYARAVAAEPGVKIAIDEKNGVIRLSE